MPLEGKRVYNSNISFSSRMLKQKTALKNFSQNFNIQREKIPEEKMALLPLIFRNKNLKLFLSLGLKYTLEIKMA